MDFCFKADGVDKKFAYNFLVYSEGGRTHAVNVFHINGVLRDAKSLRQRSQNSLIGKIFGFTLNVESTIYDFLGILVL